MKLFTLVIVFFSVQICFGQINPLQINFGQLRYDLLNDPITQEDLEVILNTFSSFGDNEVILNEIISSFLIKKDNSDAKNIIKNWLNDYSKEDSIYLSQIVDLDENFRARPFNIVWMTYFANAHNKEISVIESMISVHKAKNEHFPNYPNTDTYGGLLAPFHNYYAFSKWAINFPSEYQYFENLLKELTIENQGAYSNDILKNYIEIIKKRIRERRLIYELYLPHPIQTFINIMESDDDFEPTFAKNCNKENIDNYIQNAYKLIFSETLSKDELLVIKNYIVENDLYDPQVIYLALIISRYE